MKKCFIHPYGITVSEVQMMSIALNRCMDYKVALRIVRDELQAKKDEKGAWVANRIKVWNYFAVAYKEVLAKNNIHNLNELIRKTFDFYEIKQPT